MEPKIPPVHFDRSNVPVPGNVRQLAVGIAASIELTDPTTAVVGRSAKSGNWDISVVRKYGVTVIEYRHAAVTQLSFSGPLRVDYFAGVVKVGRIRIPSEAEIERARAAKLPDPELTLLSFAPDVPTANAHAFSKNWRERGTYAPTELAVRPGIPLLEDPPPPSTRYKASQFKYLRASMFTGKMRKVAQYLLGCPFVFDPGPDAATVEEIQPVWRYSNTELKSAGALTYRFDWGTTHGVYTAADGTPWLIEISEKGARASVLPCYRRGVLYSKALSAGSPVNRAIAAKLLGSLQPQQLDMLTHLGYLPTGEAPPTDKEFADLVKRGWAFQALSAEDIKPFYDNGEAHFPACGWAFSASGRDVVNTGFVIDEVTTYRRNRYMRLGLRGGDIVDGKPQAVTCSVTDFNEDWLSGAAARIYVPWPQYGLRNLGTRPRPWPPTGKPSPPRKRLDNVIYAYFDGEAMVRIHAATNPKGLRAESTSTDNMTTKCGITSGTSSGRTTYIGEVSGLYTTHYDDRLLPTGNEYTHTASGRFLGWQGQTFSIYPVIDCWGEASRIGTIQNKVTQSSTSSTHYSHAVYIPEYDREAYIYARWERASGVYKAGSEFGSYLGSGSTRLYYKYDRAWIVPIFVGLNPARPERGLYVYVLMRGHPGTLLEAGPRDGIPGNEYMHYQGLGWVECDPPVIPPGPCTGPLPDGPFNRPTPAVTNRSYGGTTDISQRVTMYLHRSNAAEVLLLDEQQDLDRSVINSRIEDLTPYIPEEQTDPPPIKAQVVTDAFNASILLHTAPTIDMAQAGGSYYGLLNPEFTCFIGAANGLPN